MQPKSVALIYYNICRNKISHNQMREVYNIVTYLPQKHIEGFCCHIIIEVKRFSLNKKNVRECTVAYNLEKEEKIMTEL